jgi:hypothetical protein
MSRPTLPPPPAGFSPEEIEAQVAAFQRKGGKVHAAEAGAQTMPASTDMHTQNDQTWRTKIDGEAKGKKVRA